MNTNKFEFGLFIENDRFNPDAIRITIKARRPGDDFPTNLTNSVLMSEYDGVSKRLSGMCWDGIQIKGRVFAYRGAPEFIGYDRVQVADIGILGEHELCGLYKAVKFCNNALRKSQDELGQHFSLPMAVAALANAIRAKWVIDIRDKHTSMYSDREWEWTPVNVGIAKLAQAEQEILTKVKERADFAA